jgi:hypothetical protein
MRLAELAFFSERAELGQVTVPIRRSGEQGSQKVFRAMRVKQLIPGSNKDQLNYEGHSPSHIRIGFIERRRVVVEGDKESSQATDSRRHTARQI